MKHNIYEVKATQQSHTFSTEKGESITIGFRVNDGWDDTVNEGISKVSQFLNSLAKDEDSAKLVGTINRLLKKDSKGNLKSSRVLELKIEAEKYNNELFDDGVDIITKAYKPEQSCYFIDAHTTNEVNKKVNIPLSISSVDFTEDITIKISSL